MPDLPLLSRLGGWISPPERMERGAGFPHGSWVVPFVLAIQTLLVSPDLMPTYAEINAFDEAKYIESGRLLLAGELRELSWGPLVALVYAPFHLIIGRSADWFVIEAFLGRVVLFIVMSLSTYLLARRFGSAVHRYSILGVLFISTAFLDVLENQSDALFVTFSGLALASLLTYVDLRRESAVVLASLFLGLAMLSRFEASILILPLLVVVLLLRASLRSVRRHLLACLLPAAIVLGVYLLAFRLASPGLDLGVGGKSYESFEVNQPITDPDFGGSRSEFARTLYGTPEENHNSVLRAILRNPAAFTARLQSNLGLLPDLYLSTFGKRLGPVLLIFALWGVYALLRRGKGLHLGILALWSAAPLVSLAFLPLHIFRQLSSSILVLSAIGLTSTLAEGLTDTERRIPQVAMALLAAYGLIDDKSAFVVAGLVMSGAFALIHLTRRPGISGPAAEYSGLAVLLAAGLILRGSYPFPNYPQIGESPEEAVVHYLQKELPIGSRIMEALPLPAAASGMVEVTWNKAPAGLSTSADLRSWMVTGDIRAVYVDARDAMRPDLVALLEAGLGAEFELGYSSEDRDLRIFLPRTPSSD